ncbi:MAG: hypothetical protein GY851_10250, partial [bacterium]|nr:hypothetical protein [bacterium]
YRDIYGSAHHKNWMWSTRSTNCITINGQEQMKHSARAQGKITAFETTEDIDVVVGDVGDSYGSGVELFKRAIIFVKPDLVIVYDRLRTNEPSTFEYWLHAVNEFDLDNPRHIKVTNGHAACGITFIKPRDLTFEQTNEYDPNPRSRVSLREWHVTARTTEKQKQMEFLVVYRPHKAGGGSAGGGVCGKMPGGYLLKTGSADRKLTALLPTDDNATL